MKKKIRNILLGLMSCLLFFVLVFVIANLFKARKPQGEYSLRDLPPASLESDNGYFTLMALSFPKDRDIFSPAVIDQIRSISRTELLELGANRLYARAKPFRELSNSLECNTRDLLVTPFAENFAKVVEHRDTLEQWFAAKPLLMERYARLVAAPRLEDFSLPLYTYPIPQVHNLIQAANLYTARHILHAEDGNWQQGTAGILAQIAFARKYCAGSRQQINKMVAVSYTHLRAHET